MSDNLFYKISLIGFLIIFGSMVFSLIEHKEKKGNSVGKILKTEQIKFLITS